MAIQVSIPAAVHTDYCGSYPLTYAFAIPAGSSGLTGQWRDTSGGAWQNLTTPAGRFDGATAVRFDYPNSRAYLSVPFTATSDDLFLRVANGTTDVGTFVGVPRFYDDRRCAVVCTYDDWWRSTHTSYLAAAEAHRLAALWMSPGLNPGGLSVNDPFTAPEWAQMQTAVTAGHLELVNHGHTHKNAATYTGSDATDEVNLADAAIKANITLPAQSRRGSTQYVQGWVRPFGSTSAESRSALAAAKYLADRSGDEDANGRVDFTYWANDGLFDPQVVSVKGMVTGGGDVAAEQAAAALFKSRFDTAYSTRSTFLSYTYAHFWPSGWGAGTPARDWTSYIGGFADIWSVGYGHLYQYRLLAQRIDVKTLPDVVGATNGVANLGGECRVPPPHPGTTGIGDVLLAFHWYETSSAGPGAFTLLRDSKATTADDYNQCSLWYRIADGTETATYTWTGNPAAHHRTAMLRIRGVDTTTPFGGTTLEFGTNSQNFVDSPAAAYVGRVIRAWSIVGTGHMTIPSQTVHALQDRASAENPVASRPAFVIADHVASADAPATAITVTGVNSIARRLGWTILVNAGADASEPEVFAAPTGLAVTPVSPTQVDLTWDAVATATSYGVERDGEVILTGHPSTSYSDAGRSPSTSYSYRVRAEK